MKMTVTKMLFAGVTVVVALCLTVRAQEPVKPVGAPVLIEGFEGGVEVATGQDFNDFKNTQLKIVADAKDGQFAGLIVSGGSPSMVFNASREGWRRLLIKVDPAKFAGATGLSFWARSRQAVEDWPVEIREGGGSALEGGVGGVAGAPARGRVALARARITIPGDNQWRQIVIPFYDGRLNNRTPLNAERISRIDFFLPYHRSVEFQIDKIEAIRAELGDVPLPQITSLGPAPVRAGAAASASSIAALKEYDELIKEAARLMEDAQTAAQALAKTRQAQQALERQFESFKSAYAGQQRTYSYQRAQMVFLAALEANRIEIDRLAEWPKRADGTLVALTPFAPETYRDYPVELAEVSYWSEGLRVTGLIAKPKGNGPFPIAIVNHGSGSMAKDHFVQIMTMASGGFVAFACDYRGQGDAEGNSRAGGPASARDVVNGVKLLKTLPFVDGGRIGMWGHSMGGSVSWWVLMSPLGQEIRAYTQISSEVPAQITDEQMRKMNKSMAISLVAGGDEPAAADRLGPQLERMVKLGMTAKIKVYPGYTHHAMKFNAALFEALAFLQDNVMADAKQQKADAGRTGN